MRAAIEERPRSLHRFSRGERAVHGTIAVLMLTSSLTAATLSIGSLALLVAHRHVVELVHVYAGYALPAPILIGLLSAAYRADLTRLNRFTASDWRWLRSRTGRDGTIRVGKFNAGQKLNAALTAGAITGVLGTGVLMNFTGLVRLSWRIGATFVHDWFALGLGLLVRGHHYFALNDREARRDVRSGGVSIRWAHAEHAAWAQEIETAPNAPGPTNEAPQRTCHPEGLGTRFPSPPP